MVIAGVFVYYQESRHGSSKSDILVTSEEPITGIYVGYLAKDVYTLTISSQQGELVEGELDINNAEKDSSTGTIKGTYKNGILLADYTFKSEGTESVGWVAFKKVEDGFIRGYGEVDQGTETRLINANNLTFDSSVVYKKLRVNP